MSALTLGNTVKIPAINRVMSVCGFMFGMKNTLTTKLVAVSFSGMSCCSTCCSVSIGVFTTTIRTNCSASTNASTGAVMKLRLSGATTIRSALELELDDELRDDELEEDELCDEEEECDELEDELCDDELLLLLLEELEEELEELLLLLEEPRQLILCQRIHRKLRHILVPPRDT
mmetsp:Transcript_31914/g.74190  ORF Transcript_31914/g.74190 Transcript_31914/m.74190 type:complete len:175 (-) Transcript_31914:195-719(-)